MSRIVIIIQIFGDNNNKSKCEKEIKKRLNSDKLPFAQNLLSSRHLSKNLKVQIYTAITLNVILHGCETLSLTLREEHRLRAYENRVLRRIFEPKRNEVKGGWRKLHNEEFRNEPLGSIKCWKTVEWPHDWWSLE
jgi:hypothetical protein